jgi:hypothetical protein
MIRIPGGVAEAHIGGRNLARQQRRQQHAVVGRLGLLADDGGPVAVAGASEQLLDEAQAHHAVADDDQPFAHGFVSAHAALAASLRRE